MVLDLLPNRLVAAKSVIHVTDMAAEQAYTKRDPTTVAAVELGRVRTFVAVPMLKENELIGGLILCRQEVRPFTDKQIELVKNFAAQAVIAIENARLLNELRQRTTDLSQRTTDLTEALEQQTAASEVLQVISSSIGDLQPVFASMLENATRLCDAKFGSVYRWDRDALHLAATYNLPPAFAELRKHSPFRPTPESPISRMMATKELVHTTDAASLPLYTEGRDPAVVAAVELGGVRTAVAVPIVKGDEPIGALLMYRQEVRIKSRRRHSDA
jgi:GAF domain-containing protein